MKKSSYYLWAFLSGAFLALSFPPLPFNLLAFIAFMPLFHIFVKHKPKRGHFLLLYTAFFVYHLGANWWIGSFQADTDPFLLISAIGLAIAHPFFFFAPFVPFFYLQKKLGSNAALWAFPFFWTTFEWLHSLGDFSYPWLTIGYTQVYNLHWAQFADIAGVWGISFIVVLANVLIYKLSVHFSEYPKNSKGVWSFLKERKPMFLAVSLLLIVIIPVIYSISRHQEYKHTKLLQNNPAIKTAIIQPAINPWRKWEKSSFEQIKIHLDVQDSLIKTAGSQDLIIWCETAITFVGIEFNSGENIDYLMNCTDGGKSSFMTGFSYFKMYKRDDQLPKTVKYFLGDSAKPYSTFNSALMLNPEPFSSLNPQFYSKMRLTPFAERIPYEEHLTFLKQFVEWGVGISSWEKGRFQKPLHCINQNAKASIAPIICIESIYPAFCANFASLGANLFTIITNDAWYDYTVGPEQHYQIAVMRAIESRRYLARCANTGVSGFITPLGYSLQKLPQYERIGASEILPLLTAKTIYVKYGDWLPVSCLFGTIISIAFPFIKRKSIRR